MKTNYILVSICSMLITIGVLVLINYFYGFGYYLPHKSMTIIENTQDTYIRITPRYMTVNGDCKTLPTINNDDTLLNYDNIYMRLQVLEHFLDEIIKSNVLTIEEERQLFSLESKAVQYWMDKDYINADLMIKQFGNSPLVIKYKDSLYGYLQYQGNTP